MMGQPTSDEPKGQGISPSLKSRENILAQGFVLLVVSGTTRLLLFIAICLTLLNATTSLCWSTDLDDVRQLINSGKYEEAEAFSTEQVESGIWNEKWPKTLIECLLVQGKAQPANEIYQAAIKRYPTSLSLRLMGVDVLRQCGLKDEADAASRQILLLMQSAPSRYASRDNLIAMGQYFASQGEDARQILELFYDRVRDSDPTHLGACLASAELALTKNDFKVAAETLKRGLEIAPDDPNVHYYLARTWASSDGKRSGEALNKALQLNPRHPPSLLIKAERAIDAEQYEAAALVLEIITTLNPNHQQAIALRAVLAHLRGDFQQEEKLRQEALKTWSTNPKVDHLIGRKLSDKYRFEEGAAYQRRALELDSGYLPAKFQLAQDLLRLGQDQVGWELAKQVANEDPYNVVAVNLLNLNRRIDQFTTVESNGIRLRMASDEAPIYGQEVMDLLADAKSNLCDKYKIQPNAPIIVEIFPDQRDFAIRTFGLPGGAGFLGVCFGRVITANSPASQTDNPSNWKSVLWHEFCHVVTLEKTKNRMPRWLSEGISVYEERQKNPSWGEKINPVYREMLLDESLTPVSELSSAFLAPPSPIHLQFAYYQSSLVVQFLVEKYGFDSLLGILDSLADGLSISQALEKSVGSLGRLDASFNEYAKQVADGFGQEADWSRENLPEELNVQVLEEILESSPNHYWALRSLAERCMETGKLEQAKKHLETLEQLGCFTGEGGDPSSLLATVHRELGDMEREKETLEMISNLNASSLPTLNRLIDLSTENGEWEDCLRDARRVLAINPLRADGHQAVATASKQLGQPALAINSLTSLIALSPVDPASIHYQLARAYRTSGQLEKAKEHALRTLAEAPRYREAHQLLLEIIDRSPKEPAGKSIDGDKEVGGEQAEAKP